MQRLDSIACGNGYTEAATIEDVFGSPGGYFTITGADVYMQLQYGIQGQTAWTDEVHIGPNVGSILPGCTGVRFRNYTAGVIATITAGMSEKKEPVFTIGAGGQSASGTLNINQLIISGAGDSVEFQSGAAVTDFQTGLYTIPIGTTVFSIDQFGNVLIGDNVLVGPLVGSPNNLFADFAYVADLRRLFVRTITCGEIGDPPDMIMRRAQGTYPNGPPTQVLATTSLGSLIWQGYTGTAFQGTSGSIYCRAAENITNVASGGKVVIATTPIGTTTLTDRMEFESTGEIRVSAGGWLRMPELAAAPAAPAANHGSLFMQDNGGGKTQLCVRFPTGAVQVLATEP